MDSHTQEHFRLKQGNCLKTYQQQSQKWGTEVVIFRITVHKRSQVKSLSGISVIIEKISKNGNKGIKEHNYFRESNFVSQQR